ncbi:MAG: arylsulfotransferase family protein [Kiloniellales bacterium]
MIDRLAASFFLLAVTMLAFIGGAYVILDQTFPHHFLRTAYSAGNAWIAKKTQYIDLYATDLWRDARREDRGVTIHDPTRTFTGYTLYTSGDGPTARLVAMDGTVVHEWHRPFSTVWTKEAAVKDPQPDERTYFRKAGLLPNGDLLAIYVAVGDTPWGYGMVKLNAQGEAIWSYLQHTHHDFDIAADGRIYLLTHEVTNEKIKHFGDLERPRLDDFVVILSPDGQELKKVSLTHALIGSRFKQLLYSIPYFARKDPLHTNAVELIDEAKAARFPFAKPGHVLLSFREPGLVAVLDVESETIVWATRGPWLGQHDPTLLPNGNILLFDNLGGQEEDNSSQIIEFNPESMEIVWRYRGNPDHPFESGLRSAVEPLPNGNVLITESDGGRLFEVTRDGEIAWEYINPLRGGKNDEYIPVVSWGQRIAADQLEPGFRNTLSAP